MPDAEAPSHGIVAVVFTSPYRVQRSGDIHAFYAFTSREKRVPTTILEENMQCHVEGELSVIQSTGIY
jgi:hypothetical protein